MRPARAHNRWVLGALAAGFVLSPVTQAAGLHTIGGPGGVRCGSVLFAPQPGTGTPAQCAGPRAAARGRAVALAGVNLLLLAVPVAWGLRAAIPAQVTDPRGDPL